MLVTETLQKKIQRHYEQYKRQKENNKLSTL